MNIIFTENMSKCRRTTFNAHQYSIPGTPNSMKCNAMYELTLHCIVLDHKKSRPSWLLAARVARSSLKSVCGIGGQPLLLWEICFHFPRNQLFQFDKRALSHFWLGNSYVQGDFLTAPPKKKKIKCQSVSKFCHCSDYEITLVIFGKLVHGVRIRGEGCGKELKTEGKWKSKKSPKYVGVRHIIFSVACCQN